MRELYAQNHFVKSRLFLEYNSVFTNHSILPFFTELLKKIIKKSPEREPLPGIFSGFQPLKSATD
ncbi:hypothetical protein D6C13_09405 [Rahnella woolbedingensis]|uniref:Uncharacterized protein n=1 Tax=Rahnella woolbedingensis TaxID=1510574 RepID=A0A419NAN7_9GAMM|nr:hypothetical protein D6C13_09405 [Rahnella woolbedingensis]